MYYVEIRDHADHQWELSGEFTTYTEAVDHMVECIEEGYDTHNVQMIYI